MPMLTSQLSRRFGLLSLLYLSFSPDHHPLPRNHRALEVWHLTLLHWLQTMSHKTLVFPHQGAKLEVQTVPTYALKDDYVKIAVEYASPSPLEVWRGHMGLVRCRLKLVYIFGSLLKLESADYYISSHSWWGYSGRSCRGRLACTPHSEGG
jgi:hypothetical protein